jgi:DNA-binding NarL/FixJ family response regulator
VKLLENYMEVLIPKKPTAQSRKIVKMLSIGLKQHEVAENLKVNRRVVEASIAKLLAEYGCSNATHLVATFVRLKIID